MIELVITQGDLKLNVKRSAYEFDYAINRVRLKVCYEHLILVTVGQEF